MIVGPVRLCKPPRVTIRPTTYRGVAGWMVRWRRGHGWDQAVFVLERAHAVGLRKVIKANGDTTAYLRSIWGIQGTGKEPTCT